MTKDDVIRWASAAGIQANCGYTIDGKHHPAVNALKSSVPVEWLEHFAAQAAAVEREACAQECDHRVMGDNNREDAEALRCASAIRARSTNT